MRQTSNDPAEPKRRSQFAGRGKRVNLIVSPEIYALLDATARRNGNSLSREARLAIEHHLSSSK